MYTYIHTLNICGLEWSPFNTVNATRFILQNYGAPSIHRIHRAGIKTWNCIVQYGRFGVFFFTHVVYKCLS